MHYKYDLDPVDFVIYSSLLWSFNKTKHQDNILLYPFIIHLYQTDPFILDTTF